MTTHPDLHPLLCVVLCSPALRRVMCASPTAKAAALTVAQELARAATPLQRLSRHRSPLFHRPQQPCKSNSVAWGSFRHSTPLALAMVPLQQQLLLLLLLLLARCRQQTVAQCCTGHSGVHQHRHSSSSYEMRWQQQLQQEAARLTSGLELAQGWQPLRLLYTPQCFCTFCDTPIIRLVPYSVDC